MPRLVWRPRDTVRAKALRNAATPAERSLWQYLRKSQVGGCKFIRQEPIGPYFADFVCRSKRIIVELDGASHDVTSDRDAVRTRYLRSEGFAVLRFANCDVLSNPDGVVKDIAWALQAAPTPGPSRKREGRSE